MAYQREFKFVRSWGIALLGSLLPAATLPLTGGCPPPTDDAVDGGLAFNNTTDATNQGAAYVGSAACRACHPSIAETSRLHGHAHALNRVQGQAPQYPPEGERAGVPSPPDGKTWNDVSYVIGGYQHGAFFVDRTGFVMTDGVEGVNTQWNLDFPPNGTVAGFVAYQPEQQTPLPYGHDCFRCHTTGPEPQDPNDPRSQDGRPGILGTWAEAGVQCEACHGPGSNHVPNPQARNIFVDSTVQTCARCHTRGDDPDVIVAADGFIRAGAQYAELRASGGHANFACTVCHDPHFSTIYDRSNGIRNDCRTCHPDQNMARHAGKIFVRGDYAEQLGCESCHMPFATKTTAAADADTVGNNGRMGDTRTHIFRISTDNVDFSSMFTADGAAVAKDGDGRAAVTVDFVCVRCHTDGTATGTNAVRLDVRSASALAAILHETAQ